MPPSQPAYFWYQSRRSPRSLPIFLGSRKSAAPVRSARTVIVSFTNACDLSRSSTARRRNPFSRDIRFFMASVVAGFDAGSAPGGAAGAAISRSAPMSGMIQFARLLDTVMLPPFLPRNTVSILHRGEELFVHSLRIRSGLRKDWSPFRTNCRIVSTAVSRSDGIRTRTGK